MSKKKIIIVVVAAVLAAALFIFTKSRQSVGAAATGLPVTVENAKKDTIITTVNAKGEVSLTNSELIYSNIAAEVEEVLVEKNDIVRAGDPIIRYRQRSREKIESQIREAQLNLRSAQLNLQDARMPATESELEIARLDISAAEQNIKDHQFAMEELDRDIKSQETKVSDAKRDLEKEETLLEIGAATQSDVDNLKQKLQNTEDELLALRNQKIQSDQKTNSLQETLQYKEMVYRDIENRLNTQSARNTISQREIDVQQRQLTLSQLQKELADFQQVIYSPIDGTVTTLSVSKGEVTPTDKVLMEISNVDEYVIRIDINERNATKVQIGQDAVIEGSVLGKETVSGKVSKIGFIAEEKQTSSGSERVVPVEITIDPSKSADLLKPGFSLEASITTDIREDVIVVPILATLSDYEGNSFVYVVNEENTLEVRYVEIGAYADMTVEVTGISEGETVVSQPTLDMMEGMSIMPMNIDEMLEMPEESEGEESENTDDDGGKEETEGDKQ